jgi:hypothetical protein
MILLHHVQRVFELLRNLIGNDGEFHGCRLSGFFVKNCREKGIENGEDSAKKNKSAYRVSYRTFCRNVKLLSGVGGKVGRFSQEKRVDNR